MEHCQQQTKNPRKNMYQVLRMDAFGNPTDQRSNSVQNEPARFAGKMKTLGQILYIAYVVICIIYWIEFCV